MLVFNPCILVANQITVIGDEVSALQTARILNVWSQIKQILIIIIQLKLRVAIARHNKLARGSTVDTRAESHNLGIQMKRKRLTETYMMILNLKNS